MEKINVKNLVLADIGASETFEIEGDVSGLEFPEDVRVGKIFGKAKLTRLEETILANGSFTADIEVLCSRCLESTKRKIEFTLDREYTVDRQGESEENLYVDKYLNLDLTEPIREEIVLAIPTKVLCEESCQGVCPGCGVSLNIEECKCKKIKITND